MSRATVAAIPVIAAISAILAAWATPARGGEQLPVAELVRESDAIARVEVTLAANGRSDRARVLEWISGEGAAGADATPWLGICVPTRALLERWRTSHPRHPGRPTWERILRDGRSTQVVFLRRREGALRPRCETETMLARGHAAHPDHTAFLAELRAALAAPRASASPR